MSVETGSSFAARLEGLALSAAERRLADYLQSVGEYELAVMTSSDLCGRTATSRSTIDRLSRRLGYPGLKEMRKALLHEIHEHPHDKGAAAGARPAPDSPAFIAGQVIDSMTRRATAFADHLARTSDLDRLVAALRSARSVQLFGAGESAVAASALHLRLIRLGLPIAFAEEGHTQVTLAALMQPGDLAIAFSHSGRSRATLWAARVAAECGATVAAITGGPDSPLARLAAIRLSVPSEKGLFGSDEVMSRIVAGALSEILFHCLARLDPARLATVIRIDEAFNDDRL